MSRKVVKTLPRKSTSRESAAAPPSPSNQGIVKSAAAPPSPSNQGIVKSAAAPPSPSNQDIANPEVRRLLECQNMLKGSTIESRKLNVLGSYPLGLAVYVALPELDPTDKKHN